MKPMIEDYVSDLDDSFHFADDYWSDMGIHRESEILSKFSESDWDALERLVPSKSEAWLVRCAETLRSRGAGDTHALNILLWMISNSRDIEVKFAALDGINSLVSQGLDVGENAESIRLAISSVRDEEDNDVVRIVTDSLLRHLSK